MDTPPVPLTDLPVIRTDVLVVGAGPTGLMAGLVLARAGVEALVIDAKAGPTRESRAVAVQARSMEIYDQLGLADRILSTSHLAERVQMGTSTAARTLPIERMQEADTRFPGLRVFEQSRNEALLAEALAEDDRPVRYRHSLIALLTGARAADAEVRALVSGPSGLLVVEAKWCIGADGSHSPVRAAIGATFDGVTDEGDFWVADARVSAGLVPGIVSIRMGRRLLALAFPMSDDGDFRLVGLRTPDMADASAVTARLRTEFGIELSALRWFSTYRIHHRVASAFRGGRAFLAGDAAHVHSPVGGQGMNTGLQDAHDLGLLLADVVHGRADPSALDRYEAERRPVALTLVSVTDRAFGLVARPNRLTAGARRIAAGTVFPLASRLAGSALGARLAGYLGQYRIRYPIAGRRGTGPVGLRLPPVGDNAAALQRLSWQLHVYGGTAERPAVPDWVAGPLTFPADPRGRLLPDRLHLIRPDGFVAAAVPMTEGRADARALTAAMQAQGLRLSVAG